MAIPQITDGGHADIEDAVFLPDLLADPLRTLSDPAGNLGIEELPQDDVIDDGLRISQQFGGDHIVAFCSNHNIHSDNGFGAVKSYWLTTAGRTLCLPRLQIDGHRLPLAQFLPLFFG